MVFLIPFPRKHEIENVENCSDAIMRSTDVKICTPSSMLLLTSVATVSGLIGLVHFSLRLLNVANSSWDPTSTYFLLPQAMVGEPSVTQMKEISCPGQTRSPTGIVLVTVWLETNGLPIPRN